MFSMIFFLNYFHFREKLAHAEQAKEVVMQVLFFTSQDTGEVMLVLYDTITTMSTETTAA